MQPTWLHCLFVHVVVKVPGSGSMIECPAEPWLSQKSAHCEGPLTKRQATATAGGFTHWQHRRCGQRQVFFPGRPLQMPEQHAPRPPPHRFPLARQRAPASVESSPVTPRAASSPRVIRRVLRWPTMTASRSNRLGSIRASLRHPSAAMPARRRNSAVAIDDMSCAQEARGRGAAAGCGAPRS